MSIKFLNSANLLHSTLAHQCSWSGVQIQNKCKDFTCLRIFQEGWLKARLTLAKTIWWYYKFCDVCHFFSIGSVLEAGSCICSCCSYIAHAYFTRSLWCHGLPHFSSVDCLHKQQIFRESWWSAAFTNTCPFLLLLFVLKSSFMPPQSCIPRSTIKCSEGQYISLMLSICKWYKCNWALALSSRWDCIW